MCLYLHECDDNSEVDLGYSDRRIPASGTGWASPARVHSAPPLGAVCLGSPGQSHPALAEDQLVGLTPWAPFLMDCWVLRLREGRRGVQVTQCQQSGQIRSDRGPCSTQLTVFMVGRLGPGPESWLPVRLFG